MRSVVLGRVAALLLACALPAVAARAGSPAPLLRLAQQDYGDDTGAGGGGDASGMIVRLGRLEEQVRSLTGQIEQLQYQNKKLMDDLRKMQADTDFRFQDLQRGGNAPAPPRAAAPPAKRSDAGDEMTTPAAAPATATAAQTTGEQRDLPARLRAATLST